MNSAKPAPSIGAVVIFASLGAAFMSSRANEPNERNDEQSSATTAARAFVQSLPEVRRWVDFLTVAFPTSWFVGNLAEHQGLRDVRAPGDER
jgi:hypothetical protein